MTVFAWRTMPVWLGFVAVVCVAMAALVRADNRDGMGLQPQLVDALGVPELLDVMRLEGQDYGAGIGEEFLPGGGGESWAAVVARIYDTERMRIAVELGMKAEIATELQPELIGFFESDTGRRIVEQEIEARRAFLDPATEETARQAFVAAEAMVAAGEDPVQAKRLELLRAYVEANELIELNVAGALTANLRFFRGLVEGGALEMTEDEILADVWSQEEDIRGDTTEWLMAYLLMAYAPLSDDEISAYIALSQTPAGRALNQGLFAGFDTMYADLSYALGLAVAAQMKGEDL